MSTKNFQLELGQVDYSRLETEDDFRREAKRLVPIALQKIGETAAEEMWTSMQRAFRGPGMKPNTSTSEKRKFITNAGKEYERKAGVSDRRKIEDQIVENLREEKAKRP